MVCEFKGRYIRVITSGMLTSNVKARVFDTQSFDWANENDDGYRTDEVSIEEADRISDEMNSR